MWQEGDLIHFECIVEETGKPCLTGGWARLAKDQQGLAGLSSAQATEEAAQKLKSDAVFKGMQAQLGPDLVKKVNAVFRWVITSDTGNKAPIAQWGKCHFLSAI